jgi:hypothetical protein
VHCAVSERERGANASLPPPRRKYAAYADTCFSFLLTWAWLEKDQKPLLLGAMRLFTTYSILLSKQMRVVALVLTLE